MSGPYSDIEGRQLNLQRLLSDPHALNEDAQEGNTETKLPEGSPTLDKIAPVGINTDCGK